MTRKSRNTTRTATRLCATCGTPFTWTSRNPRRRFCDPTCKARWWRAANTDATQPATADTTTTSTASAEPATSTAGTPSAVNTKSTTDTATTTNAVTHQHDPYVAGYRTKHTPSTVQNCPNCHQPIAVINLLVTSTAAYVNTPSRTVTDLG